MSRTVGVTRGAKAKCDVTFSRIVRSRGACEAFGRAGRVCSPKLETAHIISRRYSNTRCVEANALCLCSSHHQFYTDHPVEWGKFIVELIGPHEYLRVYALSQLTTKVDWSALLPILRARLAELESVAGVS